MYVITETAVLLFFTPNKFSVRFFNGMFETLDSVILFTKKKKNFQKILSVYQTKLSGKNVTVCLLQTQTLFLTICIKLLASKLCCAVSSGRLCLYHYCMKWTKKEEKNENSSISFHVEIV